MKESNNTKNISIYKVDFKTDSKGNSYFLDVLEQLGIPETEQGDIIGVILKAVKYERIDLSFVK